MIDGYGIFPRFFLAVSVYDTWMRYRRGLPGLNKDIAPGFIIEVSHRWR
jgi:hypothetical protein